MSLSNIPTSASAMRLAADELISMSSVPVQRLVVDHSYYHNMLMVKIVVDGLIYQLPCNDVALNFLDPWRQYKQED